MISGQLFLTMLIALLVFGPKKLPMLARHVGRFVARLEYYRQQLMILWQSLLHQQQLLENTRKASEADTIYQNNKGDHD